VRSASGLSDDNLLVRVSSGDEDALCVLYERHASAMLRMIRRLTSDSAQAEEILQEAWLAVWQSAAGFRAESAPRAWLLGVARRQAHNRLRRQVVPTVELDAAADIATGGPDVEDRVLAGMEFDMVLAAVRKLPDHLRDVLDLVLVERLSYADIARILEIPVGTVKSRMAQVKKRVADGTRWGDEPEDARAGEGRA
jgi:RNA polymerase sigma-70 factor (ECF subfamily)